MNEIYSNNELKYKKRIIIINIASSLRSFPVIIVTGARQVGKSTFLQNEFKDYKYITLDDYSLQRQAVTDPFSLWKGTDAIIIDEAQKVPEIFPAIKIAVDSSKRKMRFILSGSYNMLLMHNITESLAGRAIYFEMYPMSYAEINDINEPKNFYHIMNNHSNIGESSVSQVDTLSIMLKGFMPPLLWLHNMRDVLLWWEGYIKTYIERDVRSLSNIESLIDFRKVLDAVAYRTGTIVNQTDISRDTAVSQPTVFRYLKILEVSNLIVRVPAYARSRTKRITKSPKLYFIDPALSIYCSGYHDFDSLKNARELGSFFEALVFMHLKILCESMIPKAKIFYWRTTTGKEVDFVIEHGRKLLAIEAKFTQNPNVDDITNLLLFIDEYPETVLGLLVHNGPWIQWLHSKVLAVPWWWIVE